MDQTRYWMLARRKQNERPLLGPHIAICRSPNYYESWEERAFAQDYSCIWPPRSYSCSFCRREFRSAQALGGHMNVHRRDRAQLRQSASSASSPTEESQHTQDTPPLPPHPGPLVYNFNPDPKPNPNPNSVSTVVAPLSSSGSSRLLLGRCKWSENYMVSPSFSSPLNRDIRKEEPHLSSVQLATDPILARKLIDLEEFIEIRDDETKLKKRDFPVENGDHEIMVTKRRRIDPITSPFFVNSPLPNLQQTELEVLNLCPNAVEELDLELRLGDPPKS